MELRSCALYLFIVLLSCVKADLCPKKCDCDKDNGLNRATCVDQNIIGIEVGVPIGVEVYSLSHNVISELENYCFKEAGYLSLRKLNLSYNLIFWIGLHAFSGLEQLLHLDLSNNRLRYIPSDIFWDTPRLRTLDLSSNIFETLKNEPFLMHSLLEILNLNNCRMKALPDRLFTRLPSLKKLDISENYFITLDTKVLLPLRKLERIELRNDFWKCNDEFKALETWIISKGIGYQKQCFKITNNMSEKMIAMVTKDIKEDVDISEVWNLPDPKNDTVPPTETKVLTPFEKFDKDFSAVQAFIIGAEIGMAIGIVGTYVWLRKFCPCVRFNCFLPQTRRQRRQAQRVRDGDMRANLIWTSIISPDLETPPSFRRQISLVDSTVEYPTYGVPIVREAALQVDAIRLPDRAETPPPPYHECRFPTD